MEMRDEHIELIAKYLSGQASETEVSELLGWVNASSEHADIFRKYAADWQKHHFVAAEPGKQWLSFAQKAGLNRRQLFVGRRAWMRAAAFLVLALISAYIAMYLFRYEQKILVAGKEIKTFILPDGSRLILAPGSSAVYTVSDFNEARRSIKIAGQARLEVIHNEKAPFEALAGKLKIRVLGTRFFINSGDESLLPTVYLEEGRVEASLEGYPHGKVVLSPGQQAGIDPQSGTLVIIEKPDLNQTAWLTGHFEFEATPLFRVIWFIHKAYGIEVEFANPGIGNCTLTATFDNKKPEEMLRIIAATLGLQISGTSGHYVLSGNACQ